MERGKFDNAHELLHAGQPRVRQAPHRGAARRARSCSAPPTTTTSSATCCAAKASSTTRSTDYTRAKALRDQAQGGNGRVTDEMMALSTSHLKLGSIYQSRGESSVAADEYKASLKLRDSLLATPPDNAQVQKAVLDTLEQLAVVETSLGDDSAAIATYRARAADRADARASRSDEHRLGVPARQHARRSRSGRYVATGSFQDGLDPDRARRRGSPQA